MVSDRLWDASISFRLFRRGIRNSLARVDFAVSRPEWKSARTVNAHTHADRDAGCFLAANTGRSKTFAASGVEQRLRVSAGRALGGQHRPALDRIGAGGESGQVCRGRIESDRL